MKLMYVDAKQQSHVVGKSNDIQEIVKMLVEHRKSHFVYGGNISLPGKLEPGSAYTMGKNDDGSHYFVTTDAESKAPSCNVCNTL